MVALMMFSWSVSPRTWSVNPFSWSGVVKASMTSFVRVQMPPAGVPHPLPSGMFSMSSAGRVSLPLMTKSDPEKFASVVSESTTTADGRELRRVSLACRV